MSDIKRVIALGFFDGIHLGHAALLEKTKERAAELGAVPAVLSFDIHPDKLVKGVEVKLINSSGGRADIIKRLFSIDSVIFIHFNENVMRMPWKEFILSMINELGAKHIVIGQDFNCGFMGEGKAERIESYCAELGIGCDVIPKVKKDGILVSSTHIRKLITDGEIEKANEFLGHPHMLTDIVRFGYRLGRTIGAPTINMQFPDGVLVPKYGVYAAKVILEDGEHPAVTNIGVKPTFGGEAVPTVESYILDFSGNLYGRQVRVEFYKYIREEMKFGSVEQLKEQIQKDAQTTREYFANKEEERE
jgi:riboflavin kinase/FMN adenylyltransferase